MGGSTPFSSFGDATFPVSSRGFDGFFLFFLFSCSFGLILFFYFRVGFSCLFFFFPSYCVVPPTFSDDLSAWRYGFLICFLFFRCPPLRLFA